MLPVLLSPLTNFSLEGGSFPTASGRLLRCVHPVWILAAVITRSVEVIFLFEGG